MDRKKKVKLFLVAMVVLYVLATSFGLTRDDGAMGKAMREVREVVADARAEIKKEMDKPFILRLFGSLFGMENNTFDRMKKRLPEILKNAMPDLAESFTFTPPDTGVSCEGMRLADALIYLREECVPTCAPRPATECRSSLNALPQFVWSAGSAGRGGE